MEPFIPSYDGIGLVNLVAELEHRLTSGSVSPRLLPDLGRTLPDAQTYVLVLFDGLGSHQLEHGRALEIKKSFQASIHAPFPTTTTVSLSTVATGLPPGGHGILGHLMYLPQAGRVVNTLKWRDLGGRPVDFDTTSMLPSPNFWERLQTKGVESFTVQPAPFADTPLSRMLYRGTQFEGVHDIDHLIETVSTLARTPNRLVFVYVPEIDVTAHVHGQDSEAYRRALDLASGVWTGLCHRLPSSAALVGTADHGHVDYTAKSKVRWRSSTMDRLIVFGDPRTVYLKGEPYLIEAAAEAVQVKLWPRETMLEWWGLPTREGIDDRLPDACALAPPGTLLLPRGFDVRMVGYHGGLTPAEVEIPLLIG